MGNPVRVKLSRICVLGCSHVRVKVKCPALPLLDIAESAISPGLGDDNRCRVTMRQKMGSI